MNHIEQNKLYSFEILCIEPLDNDIINESSFLKAITYSGRLWNGKECKEISNGNVLGLINTDLQISLYLKYLDTSKMLTDYSDAAYIIYVQAKNFESLESFRSRLLRHLKVTLNFAHIRILTDDISTEIANQLYPKINKVENLLRRYLVKFFTQRVGLNWWETTATKAMIEKAKMRSERRDEFSEYTDEDVTMVDFDDLGELIYKQTSGFNHPEKIIEKILTIRSMDEVQILQRELQGNYTKYFKEFFQDKHFEARWKELLRIRNKVAHQGAFFFHDLERGIQLTEALIDIISSAEEKIDEIVFSVEEKEAIRKATIAAAEEQNTQEDIENTSEQDENYFRGGLRGLKVLGKIVLPEKERYLTEEEAIDQLEEAINAKYNYYVGLKWFVTTFLKNKGYVVATSYSLLNILIDKGHIDMYDVKTPDGYTVKAIKPSYNAV